MNLEIMRKYIIGNATEEERKDGWMVVGTVLPWKGWLIKPVKFLFEAVFKISLIERLLND